MLHVDACRIILVYPEVGDEAGNKWLEIEENSLGDCEKTVYFDFYTLIYVLSKILIHLPYIKQSLFINVNYISQSKCGCKKGVRGLKQP